MAGDELLKILNAFRKNISRIYTQFETTIIDQDLRLEDYQKKKAKKKKRKKDLTSA